MASGLEAAPNRSRSRRQAGPGDTWIFGRIRSGLRQRPDATSLLRTIFALHAHRVFWPADMAVGPRREAIAGICAPDTGLPIEGGLISADPAVPNLEIEASAGARKLLERTPQLFSADFPQPDR